MRLTSLGIGLVIALVAGCKEEESKKIPFPDGKSASGAAARTEPPATPLPPNHPPIDRPLEEPPEPPADAEVRPSDKPGMSTIAFKGFAIDAPDTWKSQPVANPTRIAELAWPGASDDAQPIVCVFSHFGVGGGGPIEPNLQRWRDQFVDDGKPNPGTTETFTGPSTKVTLFDKTGTFKLGASQMGGGDFKPMPDWQMIAAIVEIDGGPIFVKVTGPKASVSAQKDALVAALKTLRLAETRKK